MNKLNIFQKRLIKNFCNYNNYNEQEYESLLNRLSKHALKNNIDLFNLKAKITSKNSLYLYNDFTQIKVNSKLNILSKISISNYIMHQIKAL